MSLCSLVRRTRSATDCTTHTSWPPLLWIRSASVHLHLCSRKISTSCLVMFTTERAVNRHCVDHVILFSCQLFVISSASSSSHACLAPSSVQCCAPLDVPPTLELSADSEMVLELPSLLPSLLRLPQLQDAPQFLLVLQGTLLPLVPHERMLSVDSTWDLQPYLLVARRQRSQLINLRIRVHVVFLTFHHNFIVQTPFIKCLGIFLPFLSFTMYLPVLVNCA